MKIETEFTIYCVHTDRHRNNVWKPMRIIQFEPDRRITATCDECGGSIAIELEHFFPIKEGKNVD